MSISCLIIPIPIPSFLRAFVVLGEIHYILGNSNTKFRAFSGGDTYYGVMGGTGKGGPFQRIIVCREFASDD